MRPASQNGSTLKQLSQATQNPSVKKGQYKSAPRPQGSGVSESGRRYYAVADDGKEWPHELKEYNRRFADTLHVIKRRHDSVVTTVGG